MSTTWGPPIPKGSDVWPGPGRMPWLTDDMWDKAVALLTDGREQLPSHDRIRNPDEWVWASIAAIRLPADHFAYQCIAWNAAHPGQPPFFPWGGGETAPEDWDGDAVLRRQGTAREWPIARESFCWRHDTDPADPTEVIGYRRATPASTPAPLDEAAQAADDWTVRAVALLTTLKAANPVHYPRSVLAWLDEATNIANLPSFPKAVDPDAEEAERIAYEAGDLLPRELVLLGIKAGRERKA